MKASAAARSDAVRPDRVVVLQPHHFNSRWPRRPAGEVAIGLRILGEDDTLLATTEAANEATSGDRREEVQQHRFDEALACWTVGLAATNPNDAGEPWFETGSALVKVALTPAAIAHLLHELELAIVAASPTRPEISPEEQDDLSFLLADPGALSHLGVAQARRVRRWLRYCLDEMRPAESA